MIDIATKRNGDTSAFGFVERVDGIVHHVQDRSMDAFVFSHHEKCFVGSFPIDLNVGFFGLRLRQLDAIIDEIAKIDGIVDFAGTARGNCFSCLA